MAATVFIPSVRAQCPGWSDSLAAPGSGEGMNARIYDVVTFEPSPGAGRELIAGGGFTVAGSTPAADKVASWNGSAWTNLGSGCGTNDEVFALTTYEVPPWGGFGIATPGNELYAGGGFTSIDCVAANHVALWFAGAWWPLVDVSTGGNGTNGNVYALTTFDIDGPGLAPPMLIAGGQFSAVGGTIGANNVAAWTGTNWFPLGTCPAGGTAGGIQPGRVDALCVFDAGGGPELYAGGWFTSADTGSCTVPANLVAKWNPLTNSWSAVGALTGTNVYDLIVFDDDGSSGANPPALYAGGNFSVTGGAHVARFDGTNWVTVGVGFNDVVRDLCAYACGGKQRLIASGHFTGSGSNVTNCVAYYNGTSWAPIGAGLGVESPPIALCAQQWGPAYDLYVGGIFTQADGHASSYIAAGCVCPAAPFPVPTGIAAVTTFATATEFPLSLVDVRPPFPTPDTNWQAPMFHNEYQPSAASEVWSEANLGQVFGVCFDTQSPPNIYVAATTTYNSDSFGPGGPGAIYKIDGTTGDISTFVSTWPHPTLAPLSNGQAPLFNQLPNTGPGLGDICHDPFHDHFYVSNFEDGKIYRISAGGGVVGSFDPFAPDDGTAGFVPLGERVWALQWFFPRQLYFSAWLEDSGSSTNTWPSAWPAYVASAGPSAPSNAIFAAGLNSITGAFLGTTALVEVLPETGGYSNPCSDIRFSPDNKRMLLAQRGMWDETHPAPHDAEALEYVGGTIANLGAWTPSANKYWIGFAPHRNAAGGADYDCDYRVLATGDALQLSPELIYGVQLIPSGGNVVGAGATNTSFMHDMNGETSNYDKTEIGDCDIFRTDCTHKWWQYCTAKLNSFGCLPSVSALGEPSASSGSGFTVSCTNVIGQKSGLLFYGLNGTAALPFQGGTMCMQLPVQRTAVQNSGGTPFGCDGVFQIDMNAYAQSGLANPALSVPGTLVDCQWWSRDPASPSTTSLSDALEYFVEP